jgi:DNA-binding transcriptional LysR family regulator
VPAAGGGGDPDGAPRAPGTVDPRLLQPFVVLAEELHFGRAAGRLHLTQSALSQQLQRLERQLGVELFERDSRRVALAPAGHAFLGGARHALEILSGAVREARRAGSGQTTVRIGMDIDLPDPLVRRVRLFGVTRPDLVVRLHLQQQDDVVADLELGRADLAIGWTAPPAAAGGLSHTSLTTVDVHGVVRGDDPLVAGRSSIPRTGLVDRRLVMYRPSRDTRAFYDFFLHAFVTPSGRRPDVVHVPVLDDAQAAMLDEVERSGGVTLCVGGDFGRFARPALVGLPFEPPLATEVVAMWRGARRPPWLAELAAFVRDGEQPERSRSLP